MRSYYGFGRLSFRSVIAACACALMFLWDFVSRSVAGLIPDPVFDTGGGLTFSGGAGVMVDPRSPRFEAGVSRRSAARKV